MPELKLEMKTSVMETYRNLLLKSESGFLPGTGKEAFEKFESLGFPVRKNESWRNTDPSPFSGFEPLMQETKKTEIRVENFLSLPVDSTVITFLDGRWVETKGQPKSGISICKLKDAPKLFPAEIKKYFNQLTSGKDAFSYLNTAFAAQGIFVKTDKSVQSKSTVFLVHLFSGPGNFCPTRNLIIAEENSKLEVVEMFLSERCNPSFLNTLSEVYLEKNSRLSFSSIKNSGCDSLQVDSLLVRQDEGSEFTGFSATLGGSVIRNQVEVCLAGQHAHTNLPGLHVTKGKSHVETTTLVDHAVPHCTSNQVFKGVATGQSACVFNGKILVRKDAQKTQAYQSGKNLLLSEEAIGFSKPQLEIFADDVKCTHGATTGQLDEDSLFYLRSRGIGFDEARKLLVRAFAEEVVEKMPIPLVREYLEARIEKNLSE